MTRLELNGSESLSCSIRTSPSALTKYFSKQKRLRVVIEAGSHSNWIAQLLERLGHEVIVAHPRQLKLISESLSKNDRRDAGLLAELGLTSPKLLAPTQPRSRHCRLRWNFLIEGNRTRLHRNGARKSGRKGERANDRVATTVSARQAQATAWLLREAATENAASSDQTPTCTASTRDAKRVRLQARSKFSTPSPPLSPAAS